MESEQVWTRLAGARTPLNTAEDSILERLGEAGLQSACFDFFGLEGLEEGEIALAGHLALENPQTVERDARRISAAQREHRCLACAVVGAASISHL